MDSLADQRHTDAALLVLVHLNGQGAAGIHQVLPAVIADLAGQAHPPLALAGRFCGWRRNNLWVVETQAAR